MTNIYITYHLTFVFPAGHCRPLLKDLCKHVVPVIADKWEDIGVQLLDSDLLEQRVLEVIAADHPHSVEDCCKRMFDKWLSTQDKANWNQVIGAIQNIGLCNLASQLEKKLKGKNDLITLQIITPNWMCMLKIPEYFIP